MPEAVTATPSATAAEPVAAAEQRADRDERAGTTMVEDELIVEEISIDGMCGVY